MSDEHDDLIQIPGLEEDLDTFDDIDEFGEIKPKKGMDDGFGFGEDEEEYFE